MVECTSINYGLSTVVTTENDEQIADHRSLLVIIEFHNIFIGQFVKSHLYHGYGTLYNLLTGCDDG